MTKDGDYVIFRNFPDKRYWEITGRLYTTYLVYDILDEKENNAVALKGAMALTLILHNIQNIGEVYETILLYMKNPQEDIFMVPI